MINMTVPTAIILKNYTQVFMLFDFANDGIVHIDWRMVGFNKKKNDMTIVSVFLWGGVMVFLKKNILIPNVAEKNILILVEEKKII